MTVSQPSSRFPGRAPGRSLAIQPWAISLVGVVAILIFLVAITL
jgi:hypothetical protein